MRRKTRFQPRFYSLGSRIQKARCTRGYTQKDMADKLGITPAAWSQYESDKREPTLSHFRKIVEILNVSGDWLLNFKEDEPNLKEEKCSDKT